MNKTDLIDQLAERLDGDKKAAQAAVEGVIDLVQREVQSGETSPSPASVSSRSVPGRRVPPAIRAPVKPSR